MARSTVQKEVAEVDAGVDPAAPVRRPGAGRKRLIDKDSDLLLNLDDLVEPDARGDQMCPPRWTSKSTGNIASALQAMGHEVSADTVRRLLMGTKEDVLNPGPGSDQRCADGDEDQREEGRIPVCGNRRLPYVPTEAEIRRYYEVVWTGRRGQDIVLIKTLLFTGVGSRSWCASASTSVGPIGGATFVVSGLPVGEAEPGRVRCETGLLLVAENMEVAASGARLDRGRVQGEPAAVDCGRVHAEGGLAEHGRDISPCGSEGDQFLEVGTKDCAALHH